MDTPDTLLFTDFQGAEANLEDVLADGLEADVSARIPGLVELLEHGQPDHKLFSAMLLLGWGRTEGLSALLAWVAAPDEVPWRAGVVSWDRFTGEDDAFGRLAWAVEQSKWLPGSSEVEERQVSAYRALLGIYSQVYFGRALGEALGAQRALAARLVPEMTAALEACFAVLDVRESRSLRFQMAALLAPLASQDSAAAARAARRVLDGADGRSRREVAFALGRGRGPEVREILSELAGASDAFVAQEAQKALGRIGD